MIEVLRQAIYSTITLPIQKYICSKQLEFPVPLMTLPHASLSPGRCITDDESWKTMTSSLTSNAYFSTNPSQLTVYSLYHLQQSKSNQPGDRSGLTVSPPGCICPSRPRSRTSTTDSSQQRRPPQHRLPFMFLCLTDDQISARRSGRNLSVLSVHVT